MASMRTSNTMASPGLLVGTWLPNERSGVIGAFWNRLKGSGICHSAIAQGAKASVKFVLQLRWPSTW